MNGVDFWPEMERRGPDSVIVAGVRVGEGSRVRLWPKSRADIFDLAAEGRAAVVESVEQDADGVFHLAVTLEDDPGRDLGEARLPGHRFFYSVDEIEPLAPDDGADAVPRVLVAGIGNIFFGDDGFGVEVARRLARREAQTGVDIVDFGIRGMDLAYALQRGYDTAILVDAARRGQSPGTLTVLELSPGTVGRPVDKPVDKPVDNTTVPVDRAVDGHGMDPLTVLAFARDLGRVPGRVLLVCCEPGALPEGVPGEDVLVGLSDPVRAALGEAERMVTDLVSDAMAVTRGGDMT
ncbi:MAG TPA: hydrogenase maturation protease [Thermopolyspora sp.]